jgi:predicted homoserine dehydrogenase-like protein
MAAVSNATGLVPQDDGLRFPVATRDDLVELPGGLSRRGTVEVVAGEDLRWGVYVVFAPSDELARRSLGEYGVQMDSDGRFAALYRPSHLIGLELGVSVLRAGLRGEATGFARALNADVVCVAKRDLESGESLDGEGGYCAHGRLVPIARSVEERLLPMGLSAGATVTRPVAAGETIDLDAVEVLDDELVARLRQESLAV